MNIENSYAARKQVMWGLVLIAVGVIFLLDRMDLVDVRSLWHYWPLLIVAAGINQTIGYPSAREFCSGLWTVFIGLWLFAVFEGFLGPPLTCHLAASYGPFTATYRLLRHSPPAPRRSPKCAFHPSLRRLSY